MPNTITPSNANAALVDLSLNAVALCAAGANSRADILLHKRKEQMQMPKTFEELMAGLEPAAADVVNKHIAGLQAQDAQTISELQGKVTDLEKAAKAPAAAEPANTSGENDVFKNASPEVREAVEKMQAQMKSLLDAQAEQLADKRYELCKAIPVEEATLREVLKSASPAVVDVLQKASAAITEGLMKAKGTSVDGAMQVVSADTAYATLEKSAKSIAAAKGITFEAAFAEACTSDPETYTKYVEGVN